MTQPLPKELENRILNLLESDVPELDSALAEIRSEYPDYSDEISRRLEATQRIRAQLSEHLTPIPLTDPDDEHEMEDFGPFHCIRLLGEGGMGRVYLAEQSEPVQREVALKVMRPGMDNKRLLERFEQERQTLSRLTHGCIAKILDAGRTNSRLWFAMEYIQGAPITEFCDRHRLDLTKRISLLIRVCDAVHHAHQRGIIHRDLKPANLLVCEEGDEAIPKIIDFGLARLSQSMEDGGQALTEAGTLLGTPEYMGPEQAVSGGAGVDVRSDVYSMGVILYELILGRLPIDFSEARRRGVLAVQKLLADARPGRPSQRWLKVEQQAEVAGLRGDTTARYGRSIAGDLDWICMRALAHDPEERYQSALALAEDLRRYLDQMPVDAGPPSTSYRLRKFVQRNRLAVGAAIAVLSSMVIGLILSIAFFLEAEDARLEMETQRNEADRQATLYRTINSVLNEDLLAGTSPEIGDKDLKVRDALRFAERRLKDRFEDAPLVEAELRASFGSTYDSLGDFESAIPHLQRAKDLFEDVSGADDPRSLDAATALASTLRSMGRWDECDALLADAIPLAADTLGEEHMTSLQLRSTRGLTQRERGNFAAAIEDLEWVHACATRTLPSANIDAQIFASNLAMVYIDQRRMDEATGLLQTARSRLREHHPDSNKILLINHRLAVIYNIQDKREEAIALHRDTLERTEEIFGPEHVRTRLALNDLGVALRTDYPEEAVGILERLIEMQRRYEPGATNTLATMNNLASTYRRLKRYAESEAYFSETLAGLQAIGLGEHSNYYTVLGNAAQVYEAQGKIDAARDAYELTLAGRRKLDPRGSRVLTTMRSVAIFYMKNDMLADSLALLEEATALGEEIHPPEHRNRHRVRLSYADALLLGSDFEASERVLLEGVGLVGSDAAQRQRYARRLVSLYETLDRPEDAALWR